MKSQGFGGCFRKKIKIFSNPSRFICMRTVLQIGFVVFWCLTTTSSWSITFPVKGRLITIDPLQQVYTVDSLQTLRKYDRKGELLFEYNNRNLGQLRSCDARDPFGVLLFYPEFNTLILLDRTLSPLSEVRLEEIGIFGTQTVASSLDKQIWVYDQQDFKLKKISRQGRLLQESVDLSRWMPNDFRAERLLIQKEVLFLVSSRQQLLHFSPFGQYLKTLPIEGGHFHFQQSPFYYFSDTEGLYLWEPFRGKNEYVHSLTTPVELLIARPQLLVCQSGNQVELYTF